jgi:amino acid transporter
MAVSTAKKRFGTAPIYFTAISTILGAILFLRFGFAVGTLGFWGTMLIILMGHTVTIPAAMAISELATNNRVKGGGEYFIISRSFGLNIGATIGIALFLSQAISVAFYIIAFTEAFTFFFNFVADRLSVIIPRQVVSLPVTLVLGVLILRKGAGKGVRTLYFVVAILLITLLLFFLGKPAADIMAPGQLPARDIRNMGDFFMVFAIVFPAFTGMTAGVGLSGDLRNPARSIPAGIILATITGLVIYILVAYKLSVSASAEAMLDNQLIMGKIALGGAVIVPIGLAASTLSTALGSVMVAPRTLQALANDTSFPSMRLNRWLAARNNDREPVNATLVTLLIAFVFVALGDVNAVAEIISMLFLVTYGSLCLISFLNHFGSSPSYRPSFRAGWYFSFTGFVVSAIVMFRINTLYALTAIILLAIIYSYLNHYHKNQKGLESLFVNTILQINRNLHVFLQKSKKKTGSSSSTPSIRRR